MRKTLLSLAALAALGLAYAPAMAGEHSMQEHVGKSMSAAKHEADKERKDMERKAKHSKDKAGKAMEEKREGKREYESKVKEMMEQKAGN